MKKWIIIAGVLAVLGMGAYYIFAQYNNAESAAQEASKIETEILANGNVEAVIHAIGKVRARQSTTLRWGTSGTIESVNVKVGDKVTAQQELARLAQGSLPQSGILAQAEVFNAQQALKELTATAAANRTKAMQDISTYEKNLRDAQLNMDNFTPPATMTNLTPVEAVNEAKARLDAARKAFEPYRYQPFNDNTRQDRKEDMDMAQADYNTAIKRLQFEYQLEVAQNNLDKARADYEKWKNGPQPGEVEAAKARIAAQQATLAQAWIASPFAAVVTRIGSQQGDTVAANDIAFRLDDLSKLYVDVRVSEIDINQMQIGQPVTLTMDAIQGLKYTGTVTDVALIGTDNSNPVDYQITVEINTPDEKVRPGMTAEVSIIVAARQNVLLVPKQAIRKENGQQVVYVLQSDGAQSPVTVKLGVVGETYSEVLGDSLKAGDTVVVFDSNLSPEDIDPGAMMIGQ